jgi:chromosome segregation ATPase
MKQKIEQLKREKLMKTFEIIYDKDQSNFSYIFKGFDADLRRKFKEKIGQLMEIE